MNDFGRDAFTVHISVVSRQDMLGLGGSSRGQQPQMRGGPVPPQQQQPGGDSFNRLTDFIFITL